VTTAQVTMIKTIRVRVWVDLGEEKWTDDDIEEEANSKYIDAIVRAHFDPDVKLETCDTLYTEVER